MWLLAKDVKKVKKEFLIAMNYTNNEKNMYIIGII